MEMTSSRVDGVVVIRIDGRIDHDRASALESGLMPYLDGPGADGYPPLLLDLENVSFLTSAGLRVLMIAAKTCKEQARRIAVAGLQPMIAEIIRIARFDLIIPVYPNTDDALAAIAPAGTS